MQKTTQVSYSEGQYQNLASLREAQTLEEAKRLVDKVDTISPVEKDKIKGDLQTKCYQSVFHWILDLLINKQIAADFKLLILLLILSPDT